MRKLKFGFKIWSMLVGVPMRERQSSDMQVENGVDVRKKEHCIGRTVGDRFTVEG